MKTRKKLIILTALILIIASFITIFIFFHRETTKNTPNTSNVDFKTRNKEVDNIEPRQKQIIDFYNSLELDKQTKIQIFYELMGPLGGLDPIASPSALPDIHATINYLYGVNFNNFNFPKDEVLYSVTAPIRHEQNFNVVGFFNKNKITLSALASVFNNDTELNALSLGYSTNYKINNYFGDDIRNYYWVIYLDPNTSPYYSYRVLSKNNKEIISLRKKYDPIFKALDILKLQTIYKCEDKVIFIVDGLADNAFGYIYNSKDSNEVNCGALNRFRIKKDIYLNEKWRFWSAN